MAHFRGRKILGGGGGEKILASRVFGYLKNRKICVLAIFIFAQQ